MRSLMEHRAIEPRQDKSEPTPDIVERAAEWLAHLESGDADGADWAGFEAWRSEHSAHELAIERLGGMGERLRGGSEVERETLRRLFLRPRRRMGGALLAVTVLGGVGWLATTRLEVQLYFADERTAVGEMRSVTLADGSRVVLSTDSAADVGQNGGRSVRLLRGELLAEVAHQGPTPFVVQTRDGTAEALGTAFTVRKDAEATLVTVVSSHVRACPAKSAGTNCLTLAPGERARLKGDEAIRLDPVSPSDAAAWSEGWLPVEDRALGDVLAELNRWRSGPIRFDAAALSTQRVSGMFPLRDTDQALANLARSQPIAIDRSDPASPIVRLRVK